MQMRLIQRFIQCEIYWNINSYRDKRVSHFYRSLTPLMVVKKAQSYLLFIDYIKKFLTYRQSNHGFILVRFDFKSIYYRSDWIMSFHCKVTLMKFQFLVKFEVLLMKLKVYLTRTFHI